jgi:hypothetical protein
VFRGLATALHIWRSTVLSATTVARRGGFRADRCIHLVTLNVQCKGRGKSAVCAADSLRPTVPDACPYAT